MPFKHNAARRHRIGKMKFKVANWAEYEAGLRRRGSLTLWMTAEALSSWQTAKPTTRGGQPRYSDLAIETALTVGLVFGLRLRQTEGLLASVLELMGLDLAVPDHTTLSRRARNWQSPEGRQDRRIPGEGPVHVLIDSTGLQVYGAGQWLEGKYVAKSRRGWRKLHLALDADSGEIVAHVMTDQDTTDASQVDPLLDQIAAPVTASAPWSSFRRTPTRWKGRASNPPVNETTISRRSPQGLMKWQAVTGYGKRSLIETAIGRYKAIIGRRLRARSFGAQQTKVAIGRAILNRMLACARPKSVRHIGTTL